MSGAARGAHKCQARKGSSQISGEARGVHKFQVRLGELIHFRRGQGNSQKKGQLPWMRRWKSSKKYEDEYREPGYTGKHTSKTVKKQVSLSRQQTYSEA
jgi:hypothetical protein